MPTDCKKYVKQFLGRICGQSPLIPYNERLYGKINTNRKLFSCQLAGNL